MIGYLLLALAALWLATPTYGRRPKNRHVVSPHDPDGLRCPKAPEATEPEAQA